MIQKAAPVTTTETAIRQCNTDTVDHWGQWWGRKYYSLEVVQHPIRARMCGFGDKDRRPLAPAAVAKMVVRRDDNSVVDVDELDCSFFLVTVDLWSADGKREMNLVLHPSSSADRYASAGTSKQKKPRASNATVPSPHSDRPSPPSSHSTPNSATEQSRISIDSQPVMNTAPSGQSTSGYNNPNYSYAQPGPSLSDAISYAGSSAYNSSPDSPNGWAYAAAGQVDRSHSFQPASLRQPTYRSDTDPSPYRNWPVADTPYPTSLQPQTANIYGGQDMDSSIRPSHPATHPDMRPPHPWSRSQVSDQTSTQPFTAAGQGDYDNSSLYSAQAYPQSQQSSQTPYYQNNYAQSTSSASPPPSSSHPLPRHTYTRTLVGPLSSNACRLLDEHRRPGIFFLFQDLSVRTEGTFRLRLRLMNVGDLPAPEAGALRVHTNVSPVLAQTFTEPFVVFSAKRFPGVPDTTPLSIAFGNQGQKLPLRNRHGTGRHGRKTQQEGNSEGSEDSDNT
ncbi:velvet factor-domain-containing protein [Phlebopus sp. FC_14]|nr:velvet factor-domain-containing protein [Phlebopus sp. FC_14]